MAFMMMMMMMMQEEAARLNRQGTSYGGFSLLLCLLEACFIAHHE
jgi:hypothetical protein